MEQESEVPVFQNGAALGHVEVGYAICGDRMYACRCGLAPGHEGAHECVDPDPQCGGSWADHPHDPHLAVVQRWPGVRPGGPSEGMPLPGLPHVEERGTRPMPIPAAPSFFPGPSLSELAP